MTKDFGTISLKTVAFLFATSLLGAILIYFKVITGSYLVAALPALYAIFKPIVYCMIRDAVYEAHHLFELDMKQEVMIEQNFRMDQAVTLDAESLLRNLHLDDEKAGRC